MYRHVEKAWSGSLYVIYVSSRAMKVEGGDIGQATDQANSFCHEWWKEGLLSWLLLITVCIQTQLPLNKSQGAFYSTLYVAINL